MSDYLKILREFYSYSMLALHNFYIDTRDIDNRDFCDDDDDNSDEIPRQQTKDVMVDDRRAESRAKAMIKVSLFNLWNANRQD